MVWYKIDVDIANKPVCLPCEGVANVFSARGSIRNTVGRT